jgi:hypothetical protein
LWNREQKLCFWNGGFCSRKPATATTTAMRIRPASATSNKENLFWSGGVELRDPGSSVNLAMEPTVVIFVQVAHQDFLHRTFLN